MQPSDKEQTKNAYQYAQLDQTNKTAGKDQTNGQDTRVWSTQGYTDPNANNK